MNSSRKTKETILKALIYGSAAFTVAMLVIIVGYIFVKGMGNMSPGFITNDYSASGDGGVYPMILATVYTVGISIVVSAPIGILSAIYLQEYAKQGRLVSAIRFCTESLAGIPSIIYGLFGGIFFVVFLKMGYSILSGSLTVAIIILPVIIRTTEEALKTVPQSFREASFALGATKLQTLYKVIVPSAMPGIISGIILSIGRVVGESAAILLTAGTVAKLPETIMSSSRTLTVHAYLLTKETGDIATASSIGIILIVIVLALNTIAKVTGKKLGKASR